MNNRVKFSLGGVVFGVFVISVLLFAKGQTGLGALFLFVAMVLSAVAVTESMD